jgi:hypothetical protein
MGKDDQPPIVPVLPHLPRPAAGDQVEVSPAGRTEDSRQGSFCEGVAVHVRHHKAPFDPGTVRHIDAVAVRCVDHTVGNSGPEVAVPIAQQHTHDADRPVGSRTALHGMRGTRKISVIGVPLAN